MISTKNSSSQRYIMEMEMYNYISTINEKTNVQLL